MAFLGIMIATCALSLAVMVSNGFEKEIKKTLKGLNADYIALPKDSNSVYLAKKSLDLMKKSNLIANYCNIGLGQVIVETNPSVFRTMNVKAVNSRTYFSVSGITTKIILPPIKVDYSKLLEGSSVIVGHKFAQDLGLKLHDSFEVFVPVMKKKNIELKKYDFKVGAIFKVGFDDYDGSTIIMNHITAKSIFKDFSTDIFMINQSKTDLHWTSIEYWNDFFSLQKNDVVKEKLIAALPDSKVLSWQEGSPILLESMKMEKLVSIFVLSLIVLVAMLNLLAFIFMKIQSKKRDIAILICMGMSPSSVASIFVFLGSIISFFASACGVGLAILIARLIDHYNLISLPGNYFFDRIIFDYSYEVFVILFVCINLFTFVMSFIPARFASMLNLSSVLRHG